MNVLDLFSGIGGFSLGLERAGMRTVAFCEIEPYCRKVLAQHWSGVPIYEDVRTLTGARLAADGIAADLICGGFPCQDITSNGAKAGIGGEQSGLWKEYARLICELRPRYVVVENVAALLSRGLDAVLGDLAAIGYYAEWHCVPASAVGAPIGREGRDRVWIVAYADTGRCEETWLSRRHQREVVACTAGGDCLVTRLPSPASDHWESEPSVGRVADGVSDWVDRIASLGNAVVPQIPEIIGRAIMAHEAAIND